MIGVIFGTTLKRSRKQLEKIIEDYKLMLIEPIDISHTRHESKVRFQNGDVWKTASNSSSRCGTRCNIAYIDIRFDERVIQESIRPAITFKPFQAEHFFDIWDEEDEAQ